MTDGHTIKPADGTVTVEVLEYPMLDTDDPPEITERSFHAVTILKNGWIRCTGDEEAEDDFRDEGWGTDVTYYPPEHVALVRTLAEDDPAAEDLYAATSAGEEGADE